jgi:N-acetylneuraminate synthase/sialic acid synthase
MKARLKKAKNNYGVYFIAEIGQNHQGSLDIALQMVDSLVGTGVSAIKTAKRDLDTCLTDEQKKAPYINPNSFGDTYYEHRKALELSNEDFIKLKEYSEKKGFDFISSFTDKHSLDFLLSIGCSVLKIASQRMQDYELLKHAANSNKTIILSSGMSDIKDIKTALDIFSNNEKYLLQCTSSYPCSEDDINLNVISEYKKMFSAKVNGFGFSGHHTGIAPDIAAYCMGAEIIERHYTLRRDMKGTDHAASLENNGVRLIMKYISEIKRAMGSSDKRVLDCEMPSMIKLRGI